MKQLLFYSISAALLVCSPKVHGLGLTLLSTGGAFTADNLALQSGASAFAQDVLSDGGWVDPGTGQLIHQIAHLNDGLYGNEHSWIGKNNPSYAGISLASGTLINQVAWGSENAPAWFAGFYHDRFIGTYTVQYTSTINPGVTTTDWLTIGSITYSGTPSGRLDRQLFSFDPVYATGLRIVTDSGSNEWSSLIRIDELEVYAARGVPDAASSFVLMCFSMAAIGAIQRRFRW